MGRRFESRNMLIGRNNRLNQQELPRFYTQEPLRKYHYNPRQHYIYESRPLTARNDHTSQYRQVYDDRAHNDRYNVNVSNRFDVLANEMWG